MCKEIALPDGCEVYCFDYFDTIVYRTVDPEYVKKLWCKEMKEYLGLSLSIEKIYAHRHQIESQLCRGNEADGMDLEFKYDQLAEKMYIVLAAELNIPKEQFMKMAEETELCIECRVQEKCMDVINEIERLKSLGKKIICISDFYASEQFMRRLMAYHGINPLFDEVFVSSEYLVTKRSGRLYDYILQIYKLPPEKYFMTGDNQWSDFECPKGKGMGAYVVNRNEQKKRYRQFCCEHEQKNYVKRHLKQIYNSCKRENYEDITFSLYCFIDKLYTVLRRRHVKDVFFLSREGEFLKKIFDFYQERRAGGGPRIKTHYLLVSRKSTFAASLKQIGEEKFEAIFRQYIHISVYDFLSSLGFSSEIQQEIGRRLKVDIYKKQQDFPSTQLYQNLLCDECFLMHYEQMRVEQKQNFKEYLESFCADFQKDGMCIVDVGWKGTIQDNIFIFFEEKIEISGLYVGLVNPGRIHSRNHKDGLLFTSIPNPSKCFYVYDENRSIFEVVLGASHGSADHYEKTSQGVAAVTDQKIEERELFQKAILPIQEAVYHCFVRIDEILMNHCFEKEELEAAVHGIHARLVFLPLKQQTDLFYQIYHYENFGIFEFTKFKKQTHISLKKRCRNIVLMLKLRRNFFQSGYWGVIALKNAGLGILIRPYGWYMYSRHYRRERS